jgi:hypothetical protein
VKRHHPFKDDVRTSGRHDRIRWRWRGLPPLRGPAGPPRRQAAGPSACG